MPAPDTLAAWLRDERADLVALAELVSLAVWVEPGLLRRLRLDLLPSSDAGLEAELRFCPLVETHNATGFALHSEARSRLRERLAADPVRLQAAWERTGAAHRDAPPTVRLEEEITFLALAGAELSAIEAKLKQALVTLIDQGRIGLANWAARALPQFPEIVRNTDAAWLLAAAASKQLGGPPVLQGSPRTQVDPALWRRALGRTGQAFIGGRWTARGVEFGPPELAGAKLFQVPRASPVCLSLEFVMRPDAPSGPQSVAFDLGERHLVPWPSPPGTPPGEVRIETLLDERHALRPLDTTATLSPAALSLQARLSAPGPKRILSLEGGGVRTAASFGFLNRLEARLRERTGDEQFRLADYFDLIGGTSAGGVIAACLALRMSVAEAEAVWHRFVAVVFGQRSSLLRQLQHRFDDTALIRSLNEVFGNRTLTDDALTTGLCVIVKRMDTGDTLSLTNHPGSRYYAQRRTVMLRDALRAALAAPTLFAPVQLPLGTEAPGAFMDAGATVTVDPAWHLFRLATSRRHPFGWRPGADDLLLVSVGAGTWRERRTAREIAEGGIVAWTAGLPNLLLRSARQQTGVLLESLGRVLTPPRTPPLEVFSGMARFTVVRYSLELDADRLAELGGEELARETEALRAIDDPKQVPTLQRLGRLAAERDVRAEHLPTGFDPSPPPDAEAPLAEGERPYVYLSYAEPDERVAQELIAQLQKAGIISQRSDRGDWAARLGGVDPTAKTAIENAALFLPLISRHSIEQPRSKQSSSASLRAEWDVALEHGRRLAKQDRPFILPVLVDDVRPAPNFLPADFTDLQMVRFEHGRFAPEVMKYIISSVSNRSGTPPP